MVAGCEHVGAEFKKFLSDRRSYAEAAGSVLDIDNQKLDAVGPDKMMDMLAHDPAPGTAKNIADKEDSHWSG